MDGTTKVILVLLVTWLVTLPLACLVHELGHALTAWRYTGRRSLVVVGGERSLLRLRLPFCELDFHPLIEEAWCWFDAKGLTVDQARAVARAGSLADAAMMLVWAGVAYAIGDAGSVLFWVAALGFTLSALSSIVELIPISRPGQLSDGGQLTRLRGRRGDEPA